MIFISIGRFYPTDFGRFYPSQNGQSYPPLTNLVNFEEFTAFLIENGPLDPDQLRLLSVLADLEAINRT